MLHSAPAFRRWPTACGIALALYFLAGAANAGLIIEIDETSPVRIDVRVEPEGLTFTSEAVKKTISLPPAVVDDLVSWAAKDRGGPLVFSIDGSLVPGVQNEYSPPAVNASLARRLFKYDVYAHNLACGGVPEDESIHPLIKATGDDSKLPHKRYEELLSASNLSDEAIWYRRLTARYVSPPYCIGELTMHVATAKTPALVEVEVHSWLHQITNQWYRDTDVPSEWDRWAARLPYRYLKQSMEEHWNNYRSAFPPMSELTSIVEAMGLLRAARSASPDSWQRFLQQASAVPWDDDYAPALETPHLRTEGMQGSVWRALSADTLSSGIRTASEANLALALLVTERRETESANRAWWQAVEAVASRDVRVKAKLALARLLAGDDNDNSGGRLRDTLSALRGEYQDAFRLRATALNRIYRKLGYALTAEDRLIVWHESKRLVKEFVDRVAARCDAPPSADDIDWWESRSQDVYSVDLLRRANTYHLADDDFIGAVACVHYHRGMAFQVGRELAYQHAHFRFLGYLHEKATRPELKARIERYRGELARAMRLPLAEEG
jgi:hypothetical protein